MTSDLRSILAHYVDSGWVDASQYAKSDVKILPAYLVLASMDMVIPPLSEVQVTSRCHQPFRAHKMVVAEGSARFDLLDLEIGLRSQFTQEARIPLRHYAGLVMGLREEVRPEPIRWPLEVAAIGSEVLVRAVISDGKNDDPGAEFEIVLLGEAVFL